MPVIQSYDTLGFVAPFQTDEPILYSQNFTVT